MGWDASRPVPWRRLVNEWLIYAAVMTAIFVVVFRAADRIVPLMAGLLVSGPIYLTLGWVLAKFGYTRRTLKEMRTPRASTTSSTADPVATRARPAPTRRTSSGRNRPRAKRR